MEEKELSSINVELSAERLHELYKRLEDEATPHAVRVRKAAQGVRQITIYCDAENVAYFNTIVGNENKAEI